VGDGAAPRRRAHDPTAGRRVRRGHRLDAGGRVGGEGSPLTAVAFTRDRAATPQLFPFGEYALLQLVGVTSSELAEMQASTTATVLDRLAERDPALRTDPARGG